MKNVVHVTVSGLFATVYFMGTADPSQRFKVTVPVQNPTIKSAKRALTTSFGSICYGSLIIALIQTLRAIVRGLSDQARSDGNLFSLFCLYCFNKVKLHLVLSKVCVYSSCNLWKGLLHCWKRYMAID